VSRGRSARPPPGGGRGGLPDPGYRPLLRRRGGSGGGPAVPARPAV